MFVNMNDDFGDPMLGSDQLLSVGLGGLRNIGNTCYMNAALQALSNCPHLTEFLLECHDIIDPNRRSPLLSHYCSLLSEFWGNERRRCFNANTILDAFCISHPMFRGYSQHDVQEFLRLFLVQLHEELKHSRFSSPVKRGTKQTAPSSSDNSSSIITDVFQGRLVSSVRCLSCNRLSNREETFMDLSLSLARPSVQTCNISSSINQSKKSSIMNGSVVKNGPVYVKTSGDAQYTQSSGSSSPKHLTRNLKMKFTSLSSLPGVDRLVSGIPWLLTMLITVTHILLSYLKSFIPSPKRWIDKWSTLTLDDCLSHYFSEAELVGENRYFCGRCNKRCNGLKQFRLVALPEILTLHLKRFSSNHMYSSKLSSPVNFPLKSLELSPFLHRDCKDKITIYDLIGVICHYGGCGGGHYTTCAYNSSTENWYEFNDEHVRKLDAEQIETLKSSAYVLFYRKRDAHLEPLRQSWQLTPAGKMCYVSRPWIIRFWTWAEPGPMTSEFLCEHSYFQPELWEMRNSLTLSIPESVWSNLHDVFGGHGIIRELIPCTDCCDAISRRQKYELSEIMKVSSSVTPSPTSYAISKKWLDVWLRFVRGKAWGNYECLSAEVWNLLYNIYGGGPAVPVRVPSYLSVSNVDENLVDSSNHSSSDQLSQKSLSTSPESQNSIQNYSKEFPVFTNGTIHEDTSGGSGWSEDKSNSNNWQLMDNITWATNLPMDPILLNGSDDTHLEVSDRGDGGNELSDKETQPSVDNDNSTEAKQLNGIHYIVNTSEISTSTLHNGNCSINDKLEPEVIKPSGDFGDYDPLQLLIHKKADVVKSYKRGSNKRRRLTPTK
ncbi:unnamed protein product [Heterobilharzia americana]|nr:unnamed protein product [Heterobilharzia americana]